MASKDGGGRESVNAGGGEDQVLDALASIKSQVACVLKHLQTARQAAEDKAAGQDEDTMEGGEVEDTQKPGAEMSRDDVKAQREAKKAAKAAKKGKGPKSEPDAAPPVSKAPEVIKPKPAPAPVKAEPAEIISPESADIPLKPKPATKAERRAIQEAQRAAKAQGSKDKQPLKSSTAPQSAKAVSSPSNADSSSAPKAELKKDPPIGADQGKKLESTPKTKGTGLDDEERRRIEQRKRNDESLFFHWDDCKTHGLFQWGLDRGGDQFGDPHFEDVEAVFKELGERYSSFVVRGSNQRTLELLNTVKEYVAEYKTPEGKGFKQEICTMLQYYLSKLKLYRPFAIGMSSAIEGLYAAIRYLPENDSEDESKKQLERWCDSFIDEKIEKAVESMAQKGFEKILDGDTILLYSLTEPVYEVFRLAGKSTKKFSLILALTNTGTYLSDYKRLKESLGESALETQVRISCINISSTMSYISSVTKVFLGGHALFTTGGVMAHAGSSTIALCASQLNIPVLFFCETYKFCDKSPTDTFYQDTLYSQSEERLILSSEVPVNKVATSNKVSDVTTAKIRYDVTPVHLVTCVITDIDMLPSSSVPVVLRVQESRSMYR